jgi:hypothetical protein
MIALVGERRPPVNGDGPVLIDRRRFHYQMRSQLLRLL